MTGARRPRPFELVPRRRFVGAPFGRRRSARRGQGDEVAGTRPYRPGDLPAHIHWPASARLSSARGTDEFVVREFYADEAPRVAIACDRRPAMAIGGAPHRLDKRAAVRACAELIAASAAAELADLAWADGASARPVRVRGPVASRLDGAFTGSERSLQLALDALGRHAAHLPAGSFVFAISDFLAPVRPATWLRCRSLGWDVVPVIVQDPVWERSFPAVGGVALPLADADGGRVEEVWIGEREARRRAAANEERHAALVRRFRRLGFDPVPIDSADPAAVSRRFGAWAERRRLLRAGRP
ncbi:MAG TPA: DUF58 domain-containing protein [Gaiellaceae bacterium]